MYYPPVVTLRDSARRALYTLAWLGAAWALIAMATGGVGWAIGPLRLSSRQPLRLALLGLLAVVVYLWRFARTEIDADGRWFDGGLRRVLVFLPALVVLTGGFVGIHYGSFAAAGSDSYGYVSQAALWLRGNLHIAQPIVQQMSWPNGEWMFAPLGYRPSSPDGTIVPTYAPGLPMLMVVFLALFGSNGPFYVVPVLGALALWLTYLLWMEVTGSRSVGTCAAILLLASLVFLAHLMLPMTDVPMTAGWALVCWLALKAPRPRSLAAGIATGAVLLIRPNLALLAGAPVIAWLWPPALTLWRASTTQGEAGPCESNWRAVSGGIFRFAAGLCPAVVVILALNARLYGSPLASGYGNLVGMYALGRAPQNLLAYGTWLIRSQTFLMGFALVPFFAASALRSEGGRASARGCFTALLALTLISYLVYDVFDV